MQVSMGEDVCMNLTGEKIHQALCASLKMVILSFPASFFGQLHY